MKLKKIKKMFQSAYFKGENAPERKKRRAAIADSPPIKRLQNQIHFLHPALMFSTGGNGINARGIDIGMSENIR